MSEEGTTPPHPPSQRRTTAAERRAAREAAEAEVMDPRRTPIALGGACLAGLAGTAVWAGIAYQTEYEFHYLAIAIGFAIGWVAVRLGGRGILVAGACAVFAAMSILLGRYVAIDLLIDDEFRFELTSEEDWRAAYDEVRTDAEDYAALGIDSDNLTTADERRLADFLVSNGFVDGPADDIGAVEIEEFLDYHDQRLRDFQAQAPDFQSWRADAERQQQAIADSFKQETGEFTILVDSFKESPFVLLMTIGGMAVAFGFVQHETTQDRRRAARAAREAAREA